MHGRTVVPDKMDGIEPGTVIHRNHDHEFLTRLRRSRPERRIAVRFRVSGSTLAAIDEDGNRAETAFDAPPAAKPERALETLRRQLAKTGETEFACAGVELEGAAPFLPVAALNALRREALDRLRAERERNRPKPEGGTVVERRAVSRSANWRGRRTCSTGGRRNSTAGTVC